MDEVVDEFGKLFATMKRNIKFSTGPGNMQMCIGNKRFRINFEQHKASESLEEALMIAKEQSNPEKLLGALINIGDSCDAAGKNNEAITHYQEALTIFQEQDVCIEETSELYIKLGNQYMTTKAYQSAIQFYREVLKIAQKHQVKEQERDALINIGYCLSENQKYDEAIEYGLQAIVLCEQLQDKGFECMVYRNLGCFYTYKCEHQTAIEYLKKALMIAKEREDEDEELVLSKIIGKTFEDDGQLKEAIPYYERALRVSELTAHKVEETSLHNHIGSIYLKLEKYEKAIECCKESLKLARQFGDEDQEYLALLRIGASLEESGRSDEAIENLKEALNVVQEQPDKVQQIKDVYQNMGILYTKLNQPERALECQQDALKCTKKLENEEQELEILVQIRSSVEKIGQYDEETIGYYSRELELYQQQDDIDNKILLFLHNGLGLCFKNTKQYKEAIAFFEKAFNIAMKLGETDEAILALNRMAFSYGELGQSDDAIPCYLAQLEIIQTQNDPTSEITVNRNLAHHYSKINDYVLSFKYHENALKVAQEDDDEEQRLGILTDIRFLMKTVRQHDEKAVEYYQKELEIHQKRNDKSNELTLCNSLASCYMTMKQYEGAVSYFEKALEIVKKLKDKGEERTICHRMAICKGEQGHVEDAIKYDMQALDIAQEQGDKANEALLYRILGVRFRNDGQDDISVQFSQRAQQLAQELGDLDTELEAERDLKISVAKISLSYSGSESMCIILYDDQCSRTG